jgi:hypothetical protein
MSRENRSAVAVRSQHMRCRPRHRAAVTRASRQPAAPRPLLTAARPPRRPGFDGHPDHTLRIADYVVVAMVEVVPRPPLNG